MEQEWKVLLLGGNGAVGKSTLARQLSEHYKVPLIEVDDIRIALQQIVDKTIHPDLFTFVNDPE
jgi:2-phosphoglycerate kinase